MKRAKQKKAKPVRPDEVWTNGAVRLERTGRVTSMSVNHTLHESPQETQARLNKAREEMAEKINSAINELVEIIRNFEPIGFICSSFVANNLVNLEEYSEPSHEGVGARTEYSHSLVMSVAEHGSRVPGEEEHERFAQLVAAVLDTFKIYCISRPTNADTNLDLEETQILGMIRHVFVRGSSMPVHEEELIRSCFEPHDEFLVKNGFITTADFICFCEDVRSQVEGKLNEHLQAFRTMKLMHDEFNRIMGEDSSLNPENVIAALKQDARFSEAISVLQSRSLGTSADFLLPPSLAELPVCKHLSLVAGANRSFLEFKKSPGWPANDSLIRTKPLIDQQGAIYCPNPTLLMYNRMNILESWIQGKDKKYYGNQYAKVRGKLVEQQALKYFAGLLPGALVFNSLYYSIKDERGHERRFEADGLIVFEDVLFLLEMKSAPFSTEALRGAQKGLQKDLDHLVTEPYNQALRTLDFIKSHTPAEFETAVREPLFRIDDASKFRRIYIVNVTLSDIGHVAARLNSARGMGFLDNRLWPWSVFLNDLRVISELLESPSEFLLYLERRLAINDRPEVSTIDELDYLGMFLHEGLYFRDKDVKNVSHLTMIGYTVDIERYYTHQEGRVQTGPKPRLNISSWYRDFVRAIEASGKPGSYHVGVNLLGLSGTEQKRIEDWFNSVSGDPKQRSLTLTGKETAPLVLVALATGHPVDQEHLAYAEMKRVQTGADELVMVFLTAGHLPSVDFRIISGPPGNMATVQRRMFEFSASKVHAYIQKNGRPGRNDQCPCGSGRKYKKCCIEMFG